MYIYIYICTYLYVHLEGNTKHALFVKCSNTEYYELNSLYVIASCLKRFLSSEWELFVVVNIKMEIFFLWRSAFFCSIHSHFYLIIASFKAWGTIPNGSVGRFSKCTVQFHFLCVPRKCDINQKSFKRVRCRRCCRILHDTKVETQGLSRFPKWVCCFRWPHWSNHFTRLVTWNIRLV